MEKIEKDSLNARVYKEIRKSILNKDLKPDSKVTVSGLSEKLGVSRTPVKNALNKLESEGLVEIKPRTGTFVKSFDPGDIKEIFDIRIALEKLACDNINNVEEETIDTLEDILQKIKTRNKDNYKRMSKNNKLNWKFHTEIVKISNNRRLLKIYNNLKGPIITSGSHFKSGDWKTRVSNELEEHTEILAALKNQNKSEMKKLVEEHLEKAKELIIRNMSK